MGKRILQSVLILVGLLIVLIACAPMLLSIHSVKQFALSYVNSRIPTKLQAENIHASWFNGITFQGLKVFDPEGKELMFFDTMRVTLNPFSLVMTRNIDAKIQAESKVFALLGNPLKASVQCAIANITQGPFRAHIQSPLLDTQLECVITDGCITLEKPLTAQYTLVTDSGVRSNKPIDLTISNEGFSIPIKPFQLNKVSIQDIQIDPGVLYCKNKGIVAMLITLFNTKSSNEISLWSTPVYAKVDEGFLRCKRFDILIAGSFPVASWGKINLIQDKLDMTLGLTGESLVQAFALGKLDPSYMIQLPIRGSLESPKLDTAAATSKIAALRLMQTKLAFTTPIGAIFGVGAMVFDKVDAPPPPTTTPFPWKLK